MKIGLKSPPSRPRLHLPEQLLGDLLGDVRPDVDDLVVPLAVGDDAVLVLLLDLGDQAPGILDETALGGRDVHVDDPDAEPGQGGIAEADVLELVEERDGDLVAQLVVALGDELSDLLLLQLLVDEAERLGHHVVQERPAHGGLDDAAVPPHPDRAPGGRRPRCRTRCAGPRGRRRADPHPWRRGAPWSCSRCRRPCPGWARPPGRHWKATGYCWPRASAPAPPSALPWRAECARPSGRRRSRR